MAAKDSNVTDDWAKWKIALALGLVGTAGLAGVWYYKRNRRGKHIDAGKGARAEDTAGNKEETAEQSVLEKATAAKNKGNKYFKGGKYDQAIECYTEAIEACPAEHRTDIATFYQNRAAAFEQLKNYKQVVEDCTKALECNNKYTKALFRRAKACEVTGDLMQCLEDVTAVCILEQFQNQQSMMLAERVLKELGRTKAEEHYKNRTPVVPSHQFVRTYFSTFVNDVVVQELAKGVKTKNDESGIEVTGDESETEKEHNETSEKDVVNSDDAEKIDTEKNNSPSFYEQALQCIRDKDYTDVVSLCHKEMDREGSPRLHEATLLCATFYQLRGEGDKAKELYAKLLDMENVDKRIRSNALIKRGSMRLQGGQQVEALQDFEKATKDDPDNSDIYHHRGQLNLLVDKVDEAITDFEKCLKLSPDFPIAHVQKCYTEYRLAYATRSPLQLKNSMKSFEETLKRFSDCAEGYALYAQALCDQQEFEKADENFLKALELEPDNSNIFVHRGLLMLQWKQDVEASARLINKAIEVDDKCEFAYETLGTIEVQKGSIDHAIELFNKAISLARTEIEMSHLYSLLNAATAQSRVAKNFGIEVPLSAMT